MHMDSYNVHIQVCLLQHSNLWCVFFQFYHFILSLRGLRKESKRKISLVYVAICIYIPIIKSEFLRNKLLSFIFQQYFCSLFIIIGWISLRSLKDFAVKMSIKLRKMFALNANDFS